MDLLKCDPSNRRSLYPLVEKYIPFMRSVYGDDDDDLCKIRDMLRRAGRSGTGPGMSEEELQGEQNGRASGRERVGQYVQIQVVAGSYKTKSNDIKKVIVRYKTKKK